MKLRWQLGLAAAIFLTIFALYPQLKLWYVQGGDWQGNYAYNDIDEVAYAAYVKALIDGRPRKNDPYTGRDDTPENPQPESLFSVQFAAPYTLALPARLLDISAPWMMIIGGAAAAFLTTLAIFWFLGKLTGDSWFAMAGSLVVLCGGALFAGEGAIGEVLFDGFSYPYFPGFRRYIPALAFPAFFAMIGIIWKFINYESETYPKSEIRNLKSLTLLAALVVLCFGYMVFSYFYAWTTAAAWLGCLGLLWLIARPDGFRRDLKALVGIGIGCIIFLLPYFYLLSKRSRTMDDVQLLVQSRAPDLTRMPEYISFIVLAMLVAGILLKIIEFRQKGTLFVLSLTLVPLVVFNQQIITGQSLQPIHYQVFIGNYVAGLALMACIGLFVGSVKKHTSSHSPLSFIKPPGNVVWTSVAVIAVIWGFIECYYTVRVLDDINLARDEQMPVARRLTELAKDDPNPNKTVVLHFGIGEGDDLPTIAPQAALWARHQQVFSGVTWQENKERYYQFLYYQGVTEQQLAKSMKDGDFVSIIALFGWGRHTKRLNAAYKPLTFGEIDREAKFYGDYIASYDPRNSPETIITYIVVPDFLGTDLANIDKWYERSDGERFGSNTLYKLKLKSF